MRQSGRVSIHPRADRLAATIADVGDTVWREVRTVAATGSTNADLMAEAHAGVAGGLVLVADHQSTGRGRLQRSWSAPPGTSLAISVLLRPQRPDGWSWLPLLTGVAVADAVRAVTGVAAGLKWPNDVLVGDGKLAGILTERAETPAGPAVVIGVGLNTTLGEEDRPVPTATSLRLAGAGEVDEVELVVSYLMRLERLVRWFDTGDADDLLRDAYTNRCVTLGRSVRAQLGDGHVEGRAEAIDAGGGLVLATATGPHSVIAGDVIHLR